MSVSKLAARVGLLAAAALMVVGGGFGTATLIGAVATGSTYGSPTPPPHPNV